MARRLWQLIDRVVQQISVQEDDGSDPDVAPLDINVNYILDTWVEGFFEHAVLAYMSLLVFLFWLTFFNILKTFFFRHRLLHEDELRREELGEDGEPMDQVFFHLFFV